MIKAIRLIYFQLSFLILNSRFVMGGLIYFHGPEEEETIF